MGSGYVLNFSNTTFADYFSDVAGINIYDDNYGYRGASKANHMRAFWETADNHTVARALVPLLENWADFETNGFDAPAPEDLAIIERLRTSAPVADAAALVAPPDADEAFETVARYVREAIDRNETEAAIDRLHTFMVKYMRRLCRRRGIEVSRDKPLHSLMGEYIKAVRAQGAIESEITLRILKSTTSILEALNGARNEQSLAHDNDLMDHDESLLVFAHVASLVRFMDTVEGRVDGETGHALDWNDAIPF
ncbi:MAG: abortive infection family protein [Coriobacteriia bacterium]|nr:abortive infection family protein [Coriobacteriia bacterium]